MARLSRTCPSCGKQTPAELRFDPGTGFLVVCRTCGRRFPPLDGPLAPDRATIAAWMAKRRATRDGALVRPDEV
jgi:hypothetical protein